MKLLQTTLFSLLMGTAIAAHADAALDKKVAKCEQLIEQRKEACDEEEALNTSDRLTPEKAPAYHAANDRCNALERKWKQSGCWDILEKKKAEDRGLSQ